MSKRFLNYSEGEVTCRDLLHITVEEIKTELADQSVMDVGRIMRTENGKRVSTASTVLTFCSPTVSAERLRSDPRRCFKCHVLWARVQQWWMWRGRRMLQLWRQSSCSGLSVCTSSIDIIFTDGSKGDNKIGYAYCCLVGRICMAHPQPVVDFLPNSLLFWNALISFHLVFISIFCVPIQKKCFTGYPG